MTADALYSFARCSIREWMGDRCNLHRLCQLQAFGSQNEQWLKSELAMHMRTRGENHSPPIGVDLERRPAEYQATTGDPRQADLVLAALDACTGWPSTTELPRLWIELKMRSHHYWGNIAEDLESGGKWKDLNAGNDSLYVALASTWCQSGQKVDIDRCIRELKARGFSDVEPTLVSYCDRDDYRAKSVFTYDEVALFLCEEYRPRVRQQG